LIRHTPTDSPTTQTWSRIFLTAFHMTQRLNAKYKCWLLGELPLIRQTPSGSPTTQTFFNNIPKEPEIESVDLHGDKKIHQPS
jgi:hypothetical protein